MSSIRELLEADLAEFDQSDESLGYELRHDLAAIILRHLDGREWTQTKLAETAGLKSSFLTRVIHSEQNCSFRTADRILRALGIEGRLVEASPRWQSSTRTLATEDERYVTEQRSAWDRGTIVFGAATANALSEFSIAAQA